MRMKEPYKTLIKVIGARVVLRMCYGCGMDISARLVRDFSLLRTVWKDVFFLGGARECEEVKSRKYKKKRCGFVYLKE